MMRRETYPVRRMTLVGLALMSLVALIWLQAVHLLLLRDRTPTAVVAVAASLDRPMGVVVDRHGYLLAADKPTYTVVVERALFPDALWPDIEAWLASQGLRAEDAVRLDGGRRWFFRDVSPEVAAAVRQKRDDLLDAGYGLWLNVNVRWRRWYPHGPTAVHVLGGSTLDRTFWGGTQQVYADFLRECRPLYPNRATPADWPVGPSAFLPSSTGCDLVLTLDLGIQYLVEKVLAEDAARYEAEWAVAVVMDPRDGRLLAAASWPTLDPNAPSATVDERAYWNRITAFLYEPGSVVKAMTWATAVDTGLVTTTTRFQDQAAWEYGNIRIQNADLRGHGEVTPEEVLALSLNVPTAQVATQIGPHTFYRYLGQFGLGRRTEVDIAPEMAEPIRQPGDPLWSWADLAVHSFGQGFRVTPIQLARAMAVIANGGYLVTPHVLAGFVRQDTYYEVAWPRGRRVIRQATARTLTRWLTTAVESLARYGKVPGLRVAGKTGTAQNYEEDKPPDVTFVGYFPADAPRVLVLVAFGAPKKDAVSENPYQVWGATAAYPTFVRVVKAIRPLLDLPSNESGP